MAIYRPPKSRWPAALVAAAVALAAGLLLGVVIGRSDSKPLTSIPLLRSTLVSAAGSLEVAAIEYRESVEGGRVVKEAEYEGSLGAVRSSRAKYSTVRSELQSLFQSQAAEIDQLYDEVENLVISRAPASQVASRLQKLESLLTGS